MALQHFTVGNSTIEAVPFIKLYLGRSSALKSVLSRYWTIKMHIKDGVLVLRSPPEERRIRYDNLDGNSTAYSTFQMTEAATISGAAASVAHLSLYFPKNFADGALRAVNITGTFAVLGAVFGITTNVSASLRGKDDPLNYFVGGCAAGVMLGAKTKSYAVGTGSCLAFGAWGAFYKQWNIEGWGKFFPPPTY